MHVQFRKSHAHAFGSAQRRTHPVCSFCAYLCSMPKADAVSTYIYLWCSGVQNKQRKRNIIIPLDPGSFADAIVQLISVSVPWKLQ